MTTYSRPVLLLLCGLLLLTLAIAVLNTLVPLWLAHEHLPTWQVGMVGSSYFTGNLLGTLLADHPQQRFALPALRETGNRLEITLQGESPDDSPRGLWQPVLLEIEQAPNG